LILGFSPVLLAIIAIIMLICHPTNLSIPQVPDSHPPHLVTKVREEITARGSTITKVKGESITRNNTLTVMTAEKSRGPFPHALPPMIIPFMPTLDVHAPICSPTFQKDYKQLVTHPTTT